MSFIKNLCLVLCIVKSNFAQITLPCSKKIDKLLFLFVLSLAMSNINRIGKCYVLDVKKG